MPQRGKSRRAATRQTQLGQRKKKQTKGPSGIPPTSDTPRDREGEEVAGSPGESRTDVSRTPALAVQRSSSSRHAEPRPAAYSYLKPELKRIFGLSAGVLAVLIALSFVLR